MKGRIVGCHQPLTISQLWGQNTNAVEVLPEELYRLFKVFRCFEKQDAMGRCLGGKFIQAHRIVIEVCSPVSRAQSGY